MYIMIISARPDNGEGNAGGTAVLWRQRGDHVALLSVADGRSGHYDPIYRADPDALIARRRAESEAAAQQIGATSICLGIPDHLLSVNAQNTEMLVRAIRRFGPEPGQGPDLIVMNRTVDYDREHRYAAQLVLDAVNLLTMPLVCPDVPAIAQMPAIAYWHDDFAESAAFRADMIVSIDDVIEDKTRLFGAHESQVFEWRPYSRTQQDQVPADPTERLTWLCRTWVEPMGAYVRASCAESLHASLPHGRYVEAFQISEYGHRPDPAEIAALFPSSHD